MTGRKPLLAAGIVVVATTLASAAAWAASGSTLKIVLPAHANGKNAFTYSLKGTFPNPAPPKPGGWVIEFSQPKTRACAATVPAETKGQEAEQVDWTPETNSPFTQTEKWHGGFIKPANLCAYMYSKPFTTLRSPGTSKLLARAQIVLP